MMVGFHEIIVHRTPCIVHFVVMREHLVDAIFVKLFVEIIP